MSSPFTEPFAISPKVFARIDVAGYFEPSSRAAQREIAKLIDQSDRERGNILERMYLAIQRQNTPRDAFAEIGQIITQGEESGIDSNHLTRRQSARLALGMLVANICNAGDSALEEYTGNKRKGDVDGKHLLQSALNVGMLLHDQKGKVVQVTPTQLLESMVIFASLEDIDISWFPEIFSKILEAQSAGMDQISKIQKLGLTKETCYSVGSAIEYRRATIGEYAKILSRLILGDCPKEIQDKAIRELLITQAGDDQRDIREDALTQVNPFIALLVQENLWNEYEKRRMGTFGGFARQYPGLEAKQQEIVHKYAEIPK